MNELQDSFQASGKWTAPPSTIVTPVGWFSRLVWPLLRYRAYGTGRVVGVTVYSGGGVTRGEPVGETDVDGRAGGNGSPPNYITGTPGASYALAKERPVSSSPNARTVVATRGGVWTEEATQVEMKP